MTLAEFLLQRIAEDDAVARAATPSEKWWNWDGAGDKSATVRAHEGPYIGSRMSNADATLIAVFDPARVLIECDAKRRIVEVVVGSWPSEYIEQQLLTHRGPHSLTDPETGKVEMFEEWTTIRLLRLLALPYADHSDYRQEWRP